MEEQGNEYWNELDQRYYLQTFKRYPVALQKGEGCKVWDVEGKEYLDALAGIAVNSLGHCNPAVVNAIKEQAEQLMHVSNFFVNKPQALLSEKLSKLSGLERVFITNSGAESVEGAIKIARKYAHQQGRGGTIISFEGSFHGRTMATIAMGKEAMQQGFEPIPEGFKQVPFNDIDTVKDTVNDDIAAIIIEPIQGEGGINPADKEFLVQLRELCDKEDIVLIFDEIQCGIGRTGKMFAKEHFGVQPDIITLAKGLGGGFPVGAVLSNEKVSSAINFGDHGTTFGGNPLACSAALATLEAIDDVHFLNEVEEKGRHLVEEVKSLEIEGLKEIRGLGLMIGIVFEFETKPLVLKMLENGVIANATAGNVLRLVPPLNITKEELSQVIHVMQQSLETVTA